jgi:thiopeptide-type bacteriocin biosynthesis protein
VSAVADWLCWHLYYHANQDDILIAGVRPLVESLYEQRLIKRFFFLRYWDGGPHLRLRFQTARTGEAKDVAALIERALQRAIDAYPSTAAIDALTYARMSSHLGAAEGAAPEPLTEDNTLVRRAYRPEQEKYGRDAAMTCAEQIFSASSTAALAAVARRPDKRARLGAGLLAMLSGLRALRYDVATAGRFLERYADFWGSYARTVQGDAIRHGDVAVAPPFQAIARAILDEGRVPERLRPWAEALAAAQSAIERVDGPIGAERLGFLATNYFHTHNNRLGLLTLDEAYLGRIGGACLPEPAL